MIIIRKRTVNAGESFTLHTIGGNELNFRRAMLNASPIFAAALADDAPCASDIRAQFDALDNAEYLVYSGDDSDVQWASTNTAPTPGVVLPTAKVANPIMAQAVANGWSPEDIIGTGQGDDPSVKGGISPRTGLCLVQMALCSPPPTWADKADDTYPWLIDGWSPPTEDFKPGNVPSKGEPEKPEDPPVVTLDDDTDLSGAVVTDLETGEPVVPNDDGTPIVARVIVEDDPSAPRLDAPPNVTSPAMLADATGYPADEIDQALTVISELAEGAGAAPSMRKANYHLKKHSLTPLDKGQHAQLTAAL